ncbi:MAG: cytochrome C oxidase subunit IV family protein [Rhodoferax sp.]|uniref:cytochrome C oxidase subunit IV family protein n=1 Tax=Rhodoferax sp. TaxID=50421 RepID=UPI001B50F91A|nr:cytochrome C oxidase subunit IV family protein [Rhodoferax sp.]MBP9905685.1 cytochrome C oxidase subunit IV family protein [Rhodoferax sp.]
MPRLSINQLWLLLLLATAVTYWLGESGRVGAANTWPVASIFALSFMKGFWVINDFMALRHAPPLWRRLLIGWLLLMIGVIVGVYALAAN